MVPPAAFPVECREAGVTGGSEEPCREDGFLAECREFLLEDEEDNLGDIGGEVGVAYLAQGGGIDEVSVLADESIERWEGTGLVLRSWRGGG